MTLWAGLSQLVIGEKDYSIALKMSETVNWLQMVICELYLPDPDFSFMGKDIVFLSLFTRS